MPCPYGGSQPLEDMVTNVPLTLAIRDYDYIAPLATGDVAIEGVDLTLIRSFDALVRVANDPAVNGGEASFSRYVQRLAGGDRSLVGLPAFVMREFRHRCFFVRRDSGLADVVDLAGKRVGTDQWPASGNTWSRALLRERGVAIENISWLVGPVNPTSQPPPATDVYPDKVQPALPGRPLREILLDGEIDALMCPWPPDGFYELDSQIARMYPDYRAAERDYYRRTGIFPAHHLVVLKRELVERQPQLVRAVYDALVEARERSERTHQVLAETSPWLLADLEEQAVLMGPDFRPYGLRENYQMVAAFCDEQYAQRLIQGPITPEEVFGDFMRM